MKPKIKNWLQQNWFTLLVLGISAYLFNLVIPSYYSKLTWKISDIVLAIVLLISILFKKTNRFYIEKERVNKKLPWSQRHPRRIALEGLLSILASLSVRRFFFGNDRTYLNIFNIFGTTTLGIVSDTITSYLGIFIVVLFSLLGFWYLLNALFNVIRNKIQKNEKRIKIENEDEDEYSEKEEWVL